MSGCVEILEGETVVGYVCAPSATSTRRRIIMCPTCKRRRRFVVFVFEWYGPSAYCLGCGDSWHDGERAPRPFRRNWRPEAIARARRMWDEVSA